MFVKSIIPELIVRNINQTIGFCSGVLGLETISVYPAENPEWVKMGNGSSYIMFETAQSLGEIIPELRNKPIDGSFNIYFEVENIEELYNKIKDSVEVIVPLVEKPFKQFSVRDVNGYILLIGQHA